MSKSNVNRIKEINELHAAYVQCLYYYIKKCFLFFINSRDAENNYFYRLTMNLLKLKVVIWKNFIIRRRHWLLTTFESLLPVVVFFLIAYARSQIKGYNKTKVEHPTYNPEYQIHYDGGFSSLLYVPNTPYYEDIIHRTVVKFQLQSDSKYIL